MIARARSAWSGAELDHIGMARRETHRRERDDRRRVNVKALSTFMGHSSITITLDRYGHLLPGSIAEVATLLDAFLGDDEIEAEAAQE